MWIAILFALIGIAYAMVRMRETFVMKYGNPFADEDIVSFGPEGKGTRLFAITPDTCPCEKPELDAGLCYEKCVNGYHGVGPVCWADTEDIGIGKVLLLNSCLDSGHYDVRDNRKIPWTDTGLLCNQPIRCASGWAFFTEGCSGGRVRAKTLTCDKYGDRENVDGLCYKKCPKDKPNHVPGMPYLCYEGSRGLSYGRGVGDVPSIFKFGGCPASKS